MLLPSKLLPKDSDFIIVLNVIASIKNVGKRLPFAFLSLAWTKIPRVRSQVDVVWVSVRGSFVARVYTQCTLVHYLHCCCIEKALRKCSGAAQDFRLGLIFVLAG